MDKVVEILTSYNTPKKVVVLGNEAIARGALEAGVNGVFSYPGTPSTEISKIFNLVNNFQNDSSNKDTYSDLVKNKVYFEYSINEKIALEKAIAFSIGGKSSMCVMKNVGMNVASDALMSITYQTIVAPVVIVICDDPGCHSSSNEQDSRHWGTMASVPVFNPATPEDAYNMTKEAFKLSSQLKLPVIVRTTTRVSHSKGLVYYKNLLVNDSIPSFNRMPEHINIPAKTAAAHKTLLDKLFSEKLDSYFKTFNKLYFEGNEKELAIISSGVSTSYLIEIIKRNDLSEKLDLFDLGLIHPFPEKGVRDFLSKGFNKVLVVEELDPIIENAVRTVVQKNKLDCEILGKNFAGLSPTGEFSLEVIDRVVSEFFEVETIKNQEINSISDFSEDLPLRPPRLCSGCPHRATYYALKLLVPREDQDTVLCGDIGCIGLGALPPLNMIDTINHMGMSISMAQGLSEALKEKEGKVVAMLGDGTFFHSGISSILNAVYTKSDILVIIFDNRTIGMTGHQDHPGATHLSKYNEIQIEPLLKGMGISHVETFMPFDIKDTFQKIEQALEIKGISVLVSKAPCVFLPDYKNYTKQGSKIIIDPDLCNTCHNHSDMEINCSVSGTPNYNLVRAKAKIKAEITMPASELACPANICNHGFFNSILEKDYNTALNMVRDKILFSRTCGDICYRPCELYSNSSKEETVPIKQLKKYVSGIDEFFKDFSSIIERVSKVPKKSKHIAIIGAGPAGISAAYDLIKDGYEVTIFEKESSLGGLIKHVIPDFRMDKDGFDYEVAQLEKMGVNFEFNTILGVDIDLDSCSKKYDGVIVAIGLAMPKKLETVDNISDENCYDAITFLKSYNNKTTNLKKGDRILIIGGGNSAIDAARSSKRFHSDNHVMIACVENKNDMPAFDEEVQHAVNEGIELIPNSYIDRCDEKEKIFVKLHSFNKKSFLKEIVCDKIIIAIGQFGEKEIYSVLGDKKIAENNRIIADNQTGYTNYNNVFVAGDICHNDHMSLIGAIASGKRAVVGLKQMLENYKYPYEGLKALLNLNEISKKELAEINLQTDLDIKNWIEKINLFQSCEKCNHCIENLACPAMKKENGKVIVEHSKCTKCGLCIDVCPNDSIKWEEEIEISL